MMKKTQPAPTFAARLAALRAERGWSQDQLARQAGVSVAAVSGWEQGRREPGWKAVQALAAALGVSTEAFKA